MSRPLTWDAEEGLRMWIAEVRISEICHRLLVPRRTVTAYAKCHNWPARTGYPRGGVPRLRLMQPGPKPEKPKRDRALVLAKWERRRYERRNREKIEDARRMLSLYGGDPLKAKRGRPKKGQEAA